MIFIKSNGKMSTHIAQNVLLESYSTKKKHIKFDSASTKCDCKDELHLADKTSSYREAEL